MSCCSLLPHNFGKYKLATFSNISRPIIDDWPIDIATFEAKGFHAQFAIM